jgi:hypothetical protein
LRLGVTGHRTLERDAEVAGRTRAVLDLIETRALPHPSATPVTYTVVSALAEGADRLVAQVVLERDGSELEVVLPLAVDDYLGDFASAESRAEFQVLLSRAVRLPVEPQHRRGRPEAYALAGCEIVDRIDILIAVWDGAPARGPGGTASVVEYAATRDVPTFVISAVDPERIDWLPLPREGSAGAMRVLADRFDLRLTSSRSRLKLLRTSFEQLDAFERERLSTNHSPVDEERARRHGAAVAEPLGIDPSFADWTFRFFVPADQLAAQYQRIYTSLALAVLLFAAMAVSVAAAHEIYFHTQPFVILAEVALMVLVAAAVFFARLRRPHDRWASYRSLAESLRSAPFIALLNSGDDDRSLARGASQFQPWFQRAFTEIWKQRPDGMNLPTDPSATCDFLVEAWINGQIDYHHRTAERYERHHRALTRLIECLFLGTFVTALIHAFGAWESPTLVFLAITLPAFGAALGGYRELRQFALHAERSRRARDRLEQVKARMQRETDTDDARALAQAAYSIMADENLDWFGVLELQNLEIVA